MVLNERAIHSLTGCNSAKGTQKALAGAIGAPGVPELGFELHLLGDSFAHRKLADESKYYDTGAGHGTELNEGLSPDRIRRRPNLYIQYVEALTYVLARRANLAHPQAALTRILSGLRMVYEPSPDTDHWYSSRYSEDEALELET